MNYHHDKIEKKWNPGQISTDIGGYYDKGGELAMFQYLSSRSLNYTLAVENGWTPVQRKGLRIYIPAVTRIAGHVYWQARGIEGQELRYDSPYGPRRDAIVVVRNTAKSDEIACVVEGPMDALAMAELTGITGIALMGLTPSDEAKDHLVMICKDYDAVVCLPDRADVEGMLLVQSYLAVRGILSKLVVPWDKKDVAEYSLHDRRTLL